MIKILGYNTQELQLEVDLTQNLNLLGLTTLKLMMIQDQQKPQQWLVDYLQ